VRLHWLRATLELQLHAIEPLFLELDRATDRLLDRSGVLVPLSLRALLSQQPFGYGVERLKGDLLTHAVRDEYGNLPLSILGTSDLYGIRGRHRSLVEGVVADNKTHRPDRYWRRLSLGIFKKSKLTILIPVQNTLPPCDATHTFAG